MTTNGSDAGHAAAQPHSLSPWHQGLGDNLALELIGPTPLARRANHDLHPAKLIHMVLYIASQIRLLCQTTLRQ